MVTKPTALVGLAAVMLAAGTGSYVAVRHNAAPPSGATGAAPPLAVEATEASVETPAPSTDLDVTGEARATPVAPAPVERTAAAPPAPSAPSPKPAPMARETWRSAAAQTEPSASDGTSPHTATSPTAEPRPTVTPEVRVPRSETAPARTSAPTTSEDGNRAAGTVRPPEPTPERSARNDRSAADVPTVEGWSRSESATSDADATQPLEARPLVVERRAEPALPPPAFIEYEIAADSVVGLEMETGVSTRTAEVEDLVEARVTRDVMVADQVAVPAGTQVLGSVVLVEQGGKLRDASRLGIRFHTLVIDERTRVPVVTETIYREAAPKGRDSVGKIGGAAVGGAILGAIFGGARGAAIGGSIGAAGGTAAAMSTEAEPAGLPPGSPLTVRLSRPAIVTVTR
ncbi:MAG: hypothetical protein O3A25_10335 [Acidobacteria bacterium]|nr:hypothetical protein [Acidobacteriota bacterium]